ncbi:hypothetical protein K466DRAFT_91996 [Polyporus arcularius HHB13444]|uniref:VWFA domain-containing protein n=1 Tax=Polyporus arcularius HHB13444 TaxID=1314778 RepID=A0A5C3Q576_9APHY|nr:hypothetical protein K466DRAFT_91996 [Polyporus arcularius HHB13444]
MCRVPPLPRQTVSGEFRLVNVLLIMAVGRLAELALLYRPIHDLLHATLEAEILNSVPSSVFRERKARLLALDLVLRDHPELTDQQREELLTRLLKSNSDVIDLPTDALPSRPVRNKGWHNLFGLLSDTPVSSSVTSTRTIQLREDTLHMDDRIFLSCLGDFADRSPLLADDVGKIVELTHKHLSTAVSAKAKELSTKFHQIQLQTCHAQVRQEVEAEKTKALDEVRIDLVREFMRHADDAATGARSAAVVEISEIRVSEQLSSFGGARMYKVKSSETRYSPPEDRYTLYPLELSERDIHLMREGASDHVPSPIVRAHSASAFTLPGNSEVVYMHLLPDSRCLLVVRNGSGDCLIYASPVSAIDHVVHKKAVKKFSRDKLGDQLLLAYDETKRVLALCTMTADSPIYLHTFTFDQNYTSLRGMGSHVNLSTWYDSPVTMKHMEFISATEELLFVDDLSRARIFSLVSRQFRPAKLQLSRNIQAVHSSPEGSCFLVAERSTEDGDAIIFRAYHWSSFGSSEGIKVDIPSNYFEHGLCQVVTSFFASSNVHLMSLDRDENLLRSISLTITRKDTEFSFREEGDRLGSRPGDQTQIHNSLVDCHAELWTRFPVVPAVRRATTTSSFALRRPRCLTFVSDESRKPVATHFAALIQTFERTTRKPVGDELKNIYITSVDHSTFFSALPFVSSTFCAGEWITELLCLIPIQIAMTKDNQFIPLKDGVWSTDFETSLLGAEVAHIVDSISFGWYESIFQSYLATKPVRVVSSMGEQSVGKSFALNHLLDASFAGSAMRTTEGVWMSVTPTDDSLIVALDFEGVHSMERSVQEDTLLVLFNTAISNLVLFRNNYAMSRDIAGLFHSFQSSASVLNPEANPMLFQSALMIIIKDVPDADKEGIKREFQHKFQQIVAAEQGNNFITRLHGNRLNIVPWPVIESKHFYTMFKAVKKRLDQQPVTHSGGAIFLQTLKTLMAKLKANDWGAMSQNMASHRVHLLLLLLPKALAFGASEIVPEVEPLIVSIGLRPFSPIHLLYRGRSRISTKPPPSTPRTLHCTSSWVRQDRRSSRAPRKKHCVRSALAGSLMSSGQRGPTVSGNKDYSVSSTTSWICALFTLTRGCRRTYRGSLRHIPTSSGSSEFSPAPPSTLRPVSECAMRSVHCQACNLGCLRAFHHEGSHNCLTDHVCVHMCQFVDEVHDGIERCGLPAGHPGSHLCDVTAHCCGKPCKLSDKKGCQRACVKRVDHDDEGHACSATIHECGHPCDLSAVTHSNSRTFSCDGLCRVASDVSHEVHRCENVQCPIECQLCKRLCSVHDHFHGMTIGAVHLCGQEHPCTALCQGGTCHIETSPQSVEATFTGRYESFQYTKYNQDAKRLPCAVIIPADKVEHEGDHMHDLGPRPFHFCNARCPDCGYYCTLPLGHTQQEHETLHGSMSKTSWAVEGPDGTVLEVNGRRFGQNDDGAPMLCSMYCRSLGRHVHVDWCRRANDPAGCGGPEHAHILVHMQPRPSEAKDWITHRLYWERTGFRDPYSQEDQAYFTKCDRMCSDPEHEATTQGPAQPSYCTLPILHPRHGLEQQAPAGVGYVSNDGHLFHCTNPADLRPTFHVIFVIDRSGSMDSRNPRPLNDTPTTRLIRRTHDNRLGAVFQSLQSFWDARRHMVGGDGARRDAYTVILFNNDATTAISHDFARTPEQLLSTVLQYRATTGTDFSVALRTAQAAMETHWSTERMPVIIFLSDGHGRVADDIMRNLCRRALALGSPVSFHGVAFGSGINSLQRMAEVAQGVERQATQEQLRRAVPSSFTEALTTVQLADTFLGLANSLAKPRGALFRGRVN